MTEIPLEQSAPRTTSETRPFYWAVRREIWENRSIYVAPLVVTAIVMFGSFISAVMLPHRIGHILALDAAKQREAFSRSYGFAAFMPIMTAFLVGIFYSLDALYGERRDRSILFWKSLPVSDRTTVLSKASIPMVVLPLLIYPLIVMTQFITLMLSTLFLLGNGPGIAALWTNVQFAQSTIALLYGVIVIALWHAPIYAWFLLVSAWARRAPLLWAVLPALVAAAFERGAFGTNHLFTLLGYRLTGWFMQAFIDHEHGGNPADPLESLTPGKFLATPGLWIGLAFAAACLAAAVRLRRNREPI